MFFFNSVDRRPRRPGLLVVVVHRQLARQEQALPAEPAVRSSTSLAVSSCCEDFCVCGFYVQQVRRDAGRSGDGRHHRTGRSAVHLRAGRVARKKRRAFQLNSEAPPPPPPPPRPNLWNTGGKQNRYQDEAVVVDVVHPSTDRRSNTRNARHHRRTDGGLIFFLERHRTNRRKRTKSGFFRFQTRRG